MPTFTLHQFNKLSNPKKYKILEDHGIYLEVFYLAGKHRVALFELSAFYVEVWLDQERDEISKAEAFTDYEKLDLFLQGINISIIYSLL